jgi:Domain of unknown function (DUF4440)
LRRLIEISACFFLALPSVAAEGTTMTVSTETMQWFQKTEQALLDAIAPGEKAAWDRVMDPSCVVTTEEGEVVTRAQFLDQLRPLPEGLSGQLDVEAFQHFHDYAELEAKMARQGRKSLERIGSYRGQSTISIPMPYRLAQPQTRATALRGSGGAITLARAGRSQAEHGLQNSVK